MDGVPQNDTGTGQAGIAVQHGHILALHGFPHQVEDGLYGDAAGDFARVVAAHAVREHQEPDILVEGNGVFVVFANFSGVRQPYTAELGAKGHSVMRFTRAQASTTTSRCSKGTQVLQRIGTSKPALSRLPGE
jgi:hypothetical protein